MSWDEVASRLLRSEGDPAEERGLAGLLRQSSWGEAMLDLRFKCAQFDGLRAAGACRRIEAVIAAFIGRAFLLFASALPRAYTGSASSIRSFATLTLPE